MGELREATEQDILALRQYLKDYLESAGLSPFGADMSALSIADHITSEFRLFVRPAEALQQEE